jgi:hypothetical protein
LYAERRADAYAKQAAAEKESEERRLASREADASDSPPTSLPAPAVLPECGPTAAREPEIVPIASPPVQMPAPNLPARSEPAALVFNPTALTGFVLGLVSIFLYAIGIIPILGVVFSAIGLGTFDDSKHKAKWMPAVGLALSGLYTIMFFSRQ